METKAINTKLKGHARVDVADVLRGLAVMGIIILHSIEHFNFYSFPDTAGQSAWLNFSDKAIWSGLFFMFGGKAYAIFALLFGFSFFIQDDNQRLRGNDFRLRFCWRLILLFLIGNINQCQFFHSGSASPLFFSRFHPATDLPAERQMDICIGMSAIDPAIATLLCNTCLSRSGICYSGHPHPQLLECNFCSAKQW